jgi:hypothetical protein
MIMKHLKIAFHASRHHPSSLIFKSQTHDIGLDANLRLTEFTFATCGRVSSLCCPAQATRDGSFELKR